MSAIVQLDRSYDIWLAYSWNSSNYGICGHVFELFDYYYILRNHFRVGIFFGENLGWPTVDNAIRSKYKFSDELIAEIKSNTVFGNKPKLVTGRNILFTDGGVTNTAAMHLYFDNILYFACGRKEVKDNNLTNVYILQDDRIYEPVKNNGINYKKRILFDQLRDIGPSRDQALVYATQSCRNIQDYSDLQQYGNVLAITNSENYPGPIDGITFVVPPVPDLFEQFTKYVYTPVERRWDCSPRFLAECHYYKKEVVFHNIDYWDVDHGLRIRTWDINNDFDSLYLRDNDEIVSILQGIIC